MRKLLQDIIILFFLTISFSACASNWTNENIAEYKSIDYKYRKGLITEQQHQKLLETCSDKGNILCSSFLGTAYFIDKNYTAAFPYLLKSQGIIKLYNTTTAPSEIYLGTMFSDGLGVLQNQDKAIEHFKICASVGEAACAYNIASEYSKKAVLTKKVMAVGDDALILSYAWLKIAQALGIKTFIPRHGKKEYMSLHIEKMQIILGEQKTTTANKIAGQICSTIPKCIQ